MVIVVARFRARFFPFHAAFPDLAAARRPRPCFRHPYGPDLLPARTPARRRVRSHLNPRLIFKKLMWAHHEKMSYRIRPVSISRRMVKNHLSRRDLFIRCGAGMLAMPLLF